MHIADFILENIEPILVEWEEFAGSLSSGTKMTQYALRDDAEGILLATARDMQNGQSAAQQVSKSQGQGGASSKESDQLDRASKLHGVARMGSGFDIMEVVSEYRALRASVLRLWRKEHPQIGINGINRFNESLDQSLAEAVGSYTDRVEQSRRMFLAILGHDLRSPLNCISMAAQLASRTATQDSGFAKLLAMIKTIFDPFIRHAMSESATQRVPGSIGLGLYIVHEIVVAHGGTIEIASTAQAGTTFTVRLPRAAPL